ncbi:aminotransferase class I/II-fold pyridoxal phosphate-dependent enzyme [Xenorhabdus lircayensis]|uniref:Pyridoxal phosphate-dependent aminotransferase family protein n=1 Tax=Xenorhabdus lircayensis TaxID=2763499 RepID=A0ABS0U653_9GAMM|nr:pyridoxal phosphate-dependent aminotransferase family protein [Xenorhabdus lircayensis]MBI6549361.1 pyridoxal phosphate-dependent aminotransferase family protein [Xenorhabdus lircayensis]
MANIKKNSYIKDNSTKNFFNGKICQGNEFLEEASERFNYFYDQGFMGMLEREFHTHAKKNSLVSFSRYQSDRNVHKVIHLGSYNYSGLNGNLEIEKCAIEAIKNYGTTSSGVRLLNGTNNLHIKLEEDLARFLGVEEVITVSSGYVANIAAISTLCREGDIVLSDMLNHQSINDALKLSGAKVITYRHCSVNSIEKILKKYAHIERKFLVTDGVFSMDGDLAPLSEIVPLCERYGAKIIVDDAHGTGHIGKNGRGVCDLFGVTAKVSIITGSLSKGLPGIGGFVATDKETAKIIRTAASPYIFSASIPPSVSASVIKAVEILQAHPEISCELEEKTKYFIKKLRSYGFELLNTESSIVPIVVYEEDKAFDLTRKLHEIGVYVNPVVYPAVAKSRARIRINLSANITYDELNFCIDAISSCGVELGLISSPVSDN